jgi:hypothetical protein
VAGHDPSQPAGIEFELGDERGDEAATAERRASASSIADTVGVSASGRRRASRYAPTATAASSAASMP